MAIIVKDGDVEKALNKLKRLNQQSGLNKEVRKRAFYLPPSGKRKQKYAEGRRRIKREKKRRLLAGF